VFASQNIFPRNKVIFHKIDSTMFVSGDLHHFVQQQTLIMFILEREKLDGFLADDDYLGQIIRL
jgi:hypothetical protein